MRRPWDLKLVVDARGSDDYTVHPRAFGDSQQHHLAVRIGPLLMYCLDGRAVSDLAEAWAAAYIRAGRMLPAHPERPRPKPRPAARQPRRKPSQQPPGKPVAGGLASGVSEVVVEGPQPWKVTLPRPDHPHATVATGWLTVRVHDQVALETHARAWSLASAVGQQVLTIRPASFHQVIATARFQEEPDRYLDPRTRDPGRGM
jgi:hypothetical protein